MTLFQLTGILLTVIAFFGYINHRLIKLPDTLGIAAVGLIVSTTATLMSLYDPKLIAWAEQLVDRIDFYEVVFHGMLGFLLFAGALHTNVKALIRQSGPILIFSTVGVALSTAVIGYTLWYVLGLGGFHLKLVHCLMFGALISPTDPIAVLSVLKKYALPEALEAKIAGESLFNDGTSVVAFLMLSGLATGAATPSVTDISLLLVKEVLGGLAFGTVAGGFALLFLRRIDSYPIEIMVTLALATGGYAMAESLHTSAPIAVVIMGLMVGNLGPRFALTEATQQHLFTFWELTDELLNLLLFGLVGLELLALDVTTKHLLVAALAVPVVLFGRWVSIAVPVALMWPMKSFSPHVIKIMTWGGLRGGISIALALSLPRFPGKDYLVAATYGVVVFSLLVQALSLGPLLRCLAMKSRGTCLPSN